MLPCCAGPDNIPKLPITSVLGVLAVGGLILEVVSHSVPLVNLILPRTLQVAAWYAAAGYLLDKRNQRFQ